jgi:protein gp37
MSTRSSIERTESTWNPLTGCTKIGRGSGSAGRRGAVGLTDAELGEIRESLAELG